jgi:hypothetical protein
MTDTPITPDEQVSSRQQAPDGFIELVRYNGLVRKVEELTLSTRGLNDQLAAMSSENEQLKAQLGLAATEKTVAVGERDKQLQEKVQANMALEKELTELRGMKLKYDVIKKLNRPELIRIADKIPAMTDPDALEVVMKDFASFADEMVTAREKQLLAGITPGVNPTQATIAATPQSEADWDRHIESLPLGSPERNQAMDRYWDFLAAKHK